MQFEISPINSSLDQKILEKINNKTKPIGSLGKLEDIAFQISRIQESLNPVLNPQIFVFASDHGIVEEGVSPYPQDVSYQMVYNFLNGGAAINVFANTENIDLKIIDIGVKHDFAEHEKLIRNKIRKATRNFLHEAAISNDELELIKEFSSSLIIKAIQSGKNCFIFGEMGIGNTSSSSMIMHKITKLDLEYCVGRGTGLDDDGLQKKLDLLKKASKRTNSKLEPFELLKEYGGYEIAAMVCSMLIAATHKTVILIDGFIASAALLIAQQIDKNILDYCIFCHQSDELGHKKILDFLKKEALLKFNMRLGEGSGAALAYPLIRSSVEFLNKMASFDEASVSQSN
jgi:nicotinate-nucleotide--dimethylbenzimidazole phosphoribosyltransferase